MRTCRLLLFALAIAAGCSKSGGPGDNGDPDPAPPDTEEGTPTPVGTSDGTPVARASIGTGGGTLASSDGQMTLTVPAGAFTSAQEVTIERISNNSPLRIGKAYRLRPEGITFAKPVSITFKYLPIDTLSYPIEASGIAYQNSKGVWMAVPGATFDLNAKTVTVQTTHFSDWSKYTAVHLVAKTVAVAPNAATGISVMVADAILAPQNTEKPLKPNQLVPAKFIKGWSLQGPGKLEGSGPTIRFIAPPRITTPPVSRSKVIAEVLERPGGTKSFKLDIEIKTVLGYLAVSINGGDEILIGALPVAKMGNSYQLATTGLPGTTALVISWPFGVGSYGFSILPAEDKAVVTLSHEGHSYGHTYVSGEDIFASSGGVKVTSMGVIDGFVTGTFRVDKAGRFPTLRNSVSIEGSFRTTKITE